MVLTEEMIMNLPIITEEELAELRVPKEELIEIAIREFNDEADEIDAIYNCEDNDTMSIEEAKERTLESVRKIYEEHGNL